MNRQDKAGQIGVSDVECIWILRRDGLVCWVGVVASGFHRETGMVNSGG
jgi:hypothetical protein